jgi:simple sugar transport system permease protein
MGVDQTISGLALNFFSLGLTSFFFLMAFGKTTELPECPVVPNLPIPLLKDIPVIGTALFSQDPFVYGMLIVVMASYIVLHKTEWGVNIHAIGEHPKAAEAAGIDVSHIRYGAALLNGLFGGLAGSYLTLALLGFFMENITSGKGYIALVVVILGRRHPVGVFLAAILVGAAEALQFRLQTMGTGIPSQMFNMFPYVITVLVLFISIGKNRTPAGLGKPHRQG